MLCAKNNLVKDLAIVTHSFYLDYSCKLELFFMDYIQPLQGWCYLSYRVRLIASGLFTVKPFGLFTGENGLVLYLIK